VSHPVPVTPDNFIRAETDRYFGMFVDRGALGSFFHHRDLPPIDLPGVRPNRDTLYSEVVVDLDAGPAMVTLPDPGDRFLSFLETVHALQDALEIAQTSRGTFDVPAWDEASRRRCARHCWS
jgi:hypothetical protein